MAGVSFSRFEWRNAGAPQVRLKLNFCEVVAANIEGVQAIDAPAARQRLFHSLSFGHLLFNGSEVSLHFSRLTGWRVKVDRYAAQRA
jgi:hypothetical protein